MKTLTGLFFLVSMSSITTLDADGDCFNTEDLSLKLRQERRKLHQPIMEQIKKEHPNFNESEVEKVFDDKLFEAFEDCRKEYEKSDPDKRKSVHECAGEKMGAEVELSFEAEKNIVLELANESKKAEIEKVIAPCATSKDDACIWINLIANETCPEVGDLF